MGLGEIAKKAVAFVSEKSPYFLTGLGAVGVVTTAVFTGHATVKATRLIDSFDRDLTGKQKFKLVWKYYIPPVVMGGVSIAAIVLANKENARRNAALSAMYAITEKSLIDYRERVEDTVGKNKEEKIQGSLGQDILDKNPVGRQEVIMTGKGDTLCYDVYSGRYFKSDIEKLRRIENDLNHDLLDAMWVSLNDVYFAMGLETVKMGDDIGWTPEHLIEFRFSSRIATDGTPCLVVDMNMQPKYYHDTAGYFA